MSKIIQVLETMATDAALVNEESMTTFLNTAEISIEQQQALTDKNTGQLAKTVSDLPEIISYFQVLPEENDEQNEDEDDSESTDSLLASSF